MHVINLRFQAFAKVSFAEALLATGVYVLWTPSAKKRPTYIGEGFIADRIIAHQRRFGATFDGVFAGTHGRPAECKRDAEIAEAVLINLGRRIDREPKHNRNAGRVGRVIDLVGKHGKLRINVSGKDPFRHPGSPSLAGKRTITIDFRALADPANETRWLFHPWRRT